MSCKYYGNSPSPIPMQNWQAYYSSFYASSPPFYNSCPCSVPSREEYDSGEEKFPCKYHDEFGLNIMYQPPYYPDTSMDHRVTTYEPEEAISSHSFYHFPEYPSVCRDPKTPPSTKMELRHSPCSASGSGRRNLSKLLHKGYNFDKTQYLLLYTYSQLQGSSDDIVWIDESKGIFLVNKPESFAQKWGEYKGIEKMDYQKVSRSFRYYYKQKNLLKKVDGKLRQYQWDLEALGALKENFTTGTPLRKVNKPIKKKTPKMQYSN